MLTLRRFLTERYLCVLVLAAQPVLFFWSSLIAKTTHIPWDLTGFHAPLVAEVVEALRQWRLPLWDPYIYGGYPFHADVAAQIFYPPAWLAFIAGLICERAISYWLEWLIAIHLMIAGAGAYKLLRRLECGRGCALFGATAFQLGCFFASQPQHLGAVAVTAWLPFAWLGVLQVAYQVTVRRFCFLAAMLAMLFLGGFPAVTLVAYGTCLIWAIALGIRYRTARIPAVLVCAMAAAALLCAVQLLPALDLSALSAASRRWMWNDADGTTPRALIGAFWPDYLHVFTPLDKTKFTENANFTFLYFYSGQLTVWLALAALFVRKGLAGTFAWIAAACLVVTCAGHVPGFLAVFRALPKAIRSAAYVEYAIAGYSLAVAAAAALVLNQLLRNRPRLAMALALATGAELLLVSANRPMNTHEDGWKRHDSTVQMMRERRLLALARSLVHETEPPRRTDTAGYSPRFTSSAPILRLPSANGDNPFAPTRMLAYRSLYTKVVPWERQYPVEKFDSALIDAAGTGFIMHNGPALDDKLPAGHWQRVPVESPEPLFIYRNLRVLDRYRLVGDVKLARDAADAGTLLKETDPVATAVVEAVHLDPAPAAASGDRGEVRVLRYLPEDVELEVQAPQDSYLVVAEGYAPGWRATIDASPAAIFPTNLAFMGTPVPQGKHLVHLRYRPGNLMWGFGISALTFMAMTALCVRFRRI